MSELPKASDVLRFWFGGTAVIYTTHFNTIRTNGQKFCPDAVDMIQTATTQFTSFIVDFNKLE
jgi:hypothetical protein